MDTVTNKTVSHPDHVKDEIFYVTLTLGWVCTAAWSLSFYPQVVLNWKRKSVVGLSFDFLAFDFVGFIVYSSYIISLLWIPKIKAEYRAENENDASPVQTADVVFSLHALLLTAFILLQCIFYERGGQKVSEWTRIVLVVLTVVIIITLIVPAASSGQRASWTWLNSINALSYIKVGVTVLKYWPQVLLNYRRKSTEGWSVHNVLLDFVGGWLSLVQMFIETSTQDSNQWPMTFENIAKYWLCVITLVFDSVFLVQHYALYARKGYQRLHGHVQGVLAVNGDDTEDGEERNDGDDATVNLNGRRYRRRRREADPYREDEELARERGLSENQWRTLHNSNGASPPPNLPEVQNTSANNTLEEIADDTLIQHVTRAPRRHSNYGAATTTTTTRTARLIPAPQSRTRQNSHASDDVSINSPGPDSADNLQDSELLPVLNESNIGHRSVEDASNTDTLNSQQSIMEEIRRAELERARREYQALGIHFVENYRHADKRHG